MSVLDPSFAADPHTQEIQNNHDETVEQIAHADAEMTVSTLRGLEGTYEDNPRDSPSTTNGATIAEEAARLTSRDRLLLREVVLHRLLSIEQIHGLLFDDAHRTVARRRIRLLRDAGWLQTWTGALRNGRRAGYALPSRRALSLILSRLGEDAGHHKHAPLVHLMLPNRTPKPMQLEQGTQPKWLRHQHEVNQLLVSIRHGRPGVAWSSSWDAPFPTELDSIVLPQPDYVLVERAADRSRIVLGEHDRGIEPVSRFLDRKIEPASEIAEDAQFRVDHFGVDDFVVHVSVVDPKTQQPMRRLRKLLDAVDQTRQADVFRFTLGGWLHAYPNEAIWFSTNNPPTSDSVHWQDHACVAG